VIFYQFAFGEKDSKTFLWIMNLLRMFEV